MLFSMLAFAFGLAVLGAILTYGVSLSGAGLSIVKTVARSADGLIAYGPITLPVGKGGTLTTRTDDNTGVVTATGHGLSVSDKVDVYWSGGVRYGMDVTVVTDANVITVDGGAGDVLPAQTTALVVTEQVSINTTIDGDNLKILGVLVESATQGSTAKAHLDMQDSGAATIEEIDLVANVPLTWDIEGGASNVFTGNVVASTKASNGSSSEVLTLNFLGLQDVSP